MACASDVPAVGKWLHLDIGQIVAFDDFTQNDDCYWWSQMCSTCVDRIGKDALENLLDDCGSGICGVVGCNNESDYYIDFPDDKIKFV